MTNLLICNAGSSSLKVNLTSVAAESAGRQSLSDAHFTGTVAELAQQLADWLPSSKQAAPIVLHRIVHGGDCDRAVAALDDRIYQRAMHWAALAPLHNPVALAVVDQVRQLWPDSQHYAVFDNALYRGMPEVAKRYAIPGIADAPWPLERYGFHGLAHGYQFAALEPFGAYDKVITLQLGSGCSASAWLHGEVIDTSMGFSPLEGLPMASRCGSLDPTLVLHLLRQHRFDLDSLERMLNKESGLKGLAPESEGDMKTLLQQAPHSKTAAFALDYFIYHLARVIGGLVTALGGLDALTFGRGMGENEPELRQRLVDRLAPFGALLDPNSNGSELQTAPLHTPESAIALYRVAVNETAAMVQLFQREYPQVLTCE